MPPLLPWLDLNLSSPAFSHGAYCTTSPPACLPACLTACRSLWGWQDVIKAVFSEKVVVVATYGDRSIRSPSVVVQLPSVIALKVYFLYG